MCFRLKFCRMKSFSQSSRNLAIWHQRRPWNGIGLLRSAAGWVYLYLGYIYVARRHEIQTFGGSIRKYAASIQTQVRRTQLSKRKGNHQEPPEVHLRNESTGSLDHNLHSTIRKQPPKSVNWTSEEVSTDPSLFFDILKWKKILPKYEEKSVTCFFSQSHINQLLNSFFK